MIKTFDEVATEAGLDLKTTYRFCRYMRARWADEEVTQCLVGYAHEWAMRFKSGTEYDASDIEGQRVLERIDRQ